MVVEMRWVWTAVLSAAFALLNELYSGVERARRRQRERTDGEEGVVVS